MHILLVIDSLGSGGAQRQLVTLATGLKGRGHQVELFIYYPQYDYFAPEIIAAGIPVHSSPKTHRFSPKVILDLRQLITQKSYAIVLSFLTTPNLYAELAMLGQTRAPLVVSERSAYLPDKPQRGLRLLQNGHRFARHVVTNSHDQRQQMIAQFGWIEPKISTIYNGLDLQKFRPSPTQTEHSTRPLQLIAIGSVLFNKNVLGLIQALAHYTQHHGNHIQIDWVGDLDKGGTAAYKEASALLETYQLAAHWRWMGPRSDIPSLLPQYDALIHPSFYEGLPNVICEAMACGLPVLASDICEHPQLIKSGKTGYLFDPYEPANIAHEMYKFAQCSQTEKKDMGKNARIFAEENFDLATYITHYESLFSSLLASNVT